VRGIITSLSLLAVLLFIDPRMLLDFIAAKAHYRLLLSLLSSQSLRFFHRFVPHTVSPQHVSLPEVLPAQGQDSALLSV